MEALESMETTESAGSIVNPEESSDVDLNSLNAPIDAADFYEDFGEIISAYSTSSGSLLSEAGVIDAFAARGFTDVKIVSYFSLDGKYTGAVEVDPECVDSHPTYDGWYISNSGEYWQISYCNGFFMAAPLEYNLELEEGGIPILVSESDSVCSYDSSTNTFFVTKPREDVLRVICVDTLNSTALNTMTKEVLEP